MYCNAIRENKILTKIPEFIVVICSFKGLAVIFPTYTSDLHRSISCGPKMRARFTSFVGKVNEQAKTLPPHKNAHHRQILEWGSYVLMSTIRSLFPGTLFSLRDAPNLKTVSSQTFIAM